MCFDRFALERKKLITAYYSHDEVSSQIIFISFIIICIPIFSLFDGTQLFPLLISIFFITICILLVELLLRGKGLETNQHHCSGSLPFG